LSRIGIGQFHRRKEGGVAQKHQLLTVRQDPVFFRPAEGGAGIRPGHARIFQSKGPGQTGRDRVPPATRAVGLSAPAGEEAAARGCESDVRADEGSRVKGEKWRANHGKLEWVGARKLAYRHAQAGKPYSCPWWADEQLYALAFLQGKCRTTQGPLRKRGIKQRAGETGPPQQRKGLQGGALKETA
jgi:hypothetical protein